MKEATATAKVILETRKARKEDQNNPELKGKDLPHPVKLRVTFQKESKYYSLLYTVSKDADLAPLSKQTIYLSENDYDRADGDAPRGIYKKIKGVLEKKQRDAVGVIEKLKPFTFDLFEEKYFDKPKDDQDLFAAISVKEQSLRDESKFNTADILSGLLTALKTFTGKDKYPFGNVTPKKLKEFEVWLLTPRTVKVGKEKLASLRKVDKDAKDERIKTLSRTTASIYIRALQKVFNDSKPEGTPNPFGKGKFVIPKWGHNKRAISQSDVAKIAGYKAEDGTMLQRSRDLWLFSFLCNGINFKDMANLKYSNIHDDTLVFERAKTAKPGAEVLQITIIITRQIGRIIDRWGVVPKLNDQYIFPILRRDMTPEQQHLAIKQMVKNTNDYMKVICTNLELPAVTTYVARHSFATVLKRSGASVEFISESLGHHDISTTQNYLAHFEIDEKRKWADMLLPDNNQ